MQEDGLPVKGREARSRFRQCVKPIRNIPTCLPCRKGQHLRCQWRRRRTGCSCACPWLVADVREAFPSLRRLALTETEDP